MSALFARCSVFGAIFGLALIGPLRAGDLLRIEWLAGGHPFGATAVRFLADGRLLSAGAGLKVWDLPSRRLERTLSRPRLGEDQIALAPDESWVATIPWHPDRALILRRLPEGRELARLALPDVTTPLASLSVSPDGNWLLASSGDARVLRWHLPSGQTLPPLQVRDFRPDSPGSWYGSLVTSNEFVATDFQSVFRARLEPPGLLWERAFEPGDVPVVSADRRCVALSEASHVVLLDAEDGATVLSISTPAEAPRLLAFSANAARLVGTHRDQPLSVWRLPAGELEFTLPGVAEGVTGLALSPDGKTLAASHGSGISVWDLEQRSGPEDLTALPSIVYSLGASTNGVVAVGCGLGHVAVFDLASGQRIAAWRPGYNGRALALAPSGQWLVTEGTNAALDVYALPETTLARSVPGPPSGVEAMELSAAGDRLAVLPRTGGPYQMRTVDWAVERSYEIRPATSLRSIRLSPDGRWLAGILPDRTTLVWRTDTGALERTLTAMGAGPGPMEWEETGPRLWLLGTDGRVVRWNVASGDAEYDRSLDINGIVNAVWLPDRSAVLVSLADHGIELWRLDRAERVAHFEEETGRACFAMTLSPDGHQLLLGRYDATLAVAGLPFFLDANLDNPGWVRFAAHGSVGPLRWEIRAPGGGWEVVVGAHAKEVALSALEPTRWVRAALVR